ncbi:hypothetical protein RHMOL_Rhmol03G0150800 [Rhododendron molle]|uniref:Uncharacterized protein n=1 Tax=Rhododendron molle TaxID=49168 RepID=A0ACC0PEK0_RHOML|nr:hypothetical protein RHMOL_Rhmol03G0150800 [Rhododendron molle]
MEVSVHCESNVGFKTPNDSFSLGDEVINTKHSTPILDPEGLRRKGRPPCKRMQGVAEKAVKKKIEKKKKTLPKGKSKEVEEIMIDHVFGTQESVVNLSYMGQSMWPNMMPHNMRPNMTQGESIFQFSPSSCPTGTGFNQFMYAFSSSQTNMSTNSTLFNSHDWRGHSNITSTQVWGGGQSNFLVWGGGQSNFLETQGQCVGGPPPSFMEMLNASNNAEE